MINGILDSDNFLIFKLSMVQIYSEQRSQRLDYTLHYIFTHIFQQDYELITRIEELKSDLPVVNYSPKEIGGAFQIKPVKLLFEEDIKRSEPLYELRNREHLLIFEDTEDGRFDLLASVFWLISRYEEYYYPKTDIHGRPFPENGWLGRNNLLKVPVVDIWLNNFAAKLNEKFHLNIKKPAFHALSTIDLDNGFKYKYKGPKRVLGGVVNDLKSFRFSNLNKRLMTILGFKKDEYDIYEWLIDFNRQKKVPLHFFILNAKRGNHDRGLPRNGRGVQSIVDTLLKNNTPFGIHPSYSSNRNILKFDRELKGLESLAKREIITSRQHYLRFNLSRTFPYMVQRGIKHDYSMGFASKAGFRSGTSRSHYYFDLKENTSTTLLFHPITVMEGTYKDYLKVRASVAFEEIMELMNVVKEHGGTFMSIWHEAQLSEKSPWRKLYMQMIDRVSAELSA